jgi:hypothetical protein
VLFNETMGFSADAKPSVLVSLLTLVPWALQQQIDTILFVVTPQWSQGTTAAMADSFAGKNAM